jgi:hypothetical protein
MLHKKYPSAKLSELLIPRETWHPFPTAHEREQWDALPQSVREGYIGDGEDALKHEWPVLLAERYLDFSRNGNRSKFEAVHFGRRGMLGSMVIAECMEGQGRFLDAIANGIWLICEESTWCVPAHIGVQKAGSGLPDTTEPIVDLFAAETSALLSWTDYLLGDKLDAVSPLIRPRVLREIKTRILNPCLERDDFWWMGFSPRRVNNWNPWINSNWLISALTMEDDPARRQAAIAKSMKSVDRFIDPYPADGGCDEGPSYWGRAGASLLDCLELLHSATDGAIDVYAEPLVQNIGKYMVRAQIADHYFLNFADAPAMLTPPPYVVFRYGQRIDDAEMMALGAWSARETDLLRQKSKQMRRYGRASLARFLPEVFALDQMYAVEPRQPLPREVWLDVIQVMVGRDQGGSKEGLFVAAKGGHNAESHNHNDIGQIVVYTDGRPVLIDAGVETYTRKTFSAQRYEIWTMQSAYHNLPTIDGVMQSPGEEYAARNVSCRTEGELTTLSLDIAGAYPPEANLVSWQRTVTLQRGKSVDVTETYELAKPVKEITLSFLTPCAVALGSCEIWLGETGLPDGRLTGKARIAYNGDKLTATAELVPITDERLTPVWGNQLIRVLLRAKNPALKDTWGWTLSKA